MVSAQYHIPVLLEASIEGLNIDPSGIYVDLTFGGGGHSRAILERLGPEGKLIAFDQDQDAWRQAPEDSRFVLVKHNFRYLSNFLDFLGISSVAGVLGDLGVSSHHFDVAERGFSFRYNGPLDMRMSVGSDLTAAKVLNSYSEEKLFGLFRTYGEINNPGRLVKSILKYRATKPFQKTFDLKEVAQTTAPRREENKYLAKVFQALRIEVNQEMSALEELFGQLPQIIQPGGRLVIISYHSLEDRMVKNFIRSGRWDTNQPETDIYGNKDVPFKAVVRKVVVPDENEIAANPRARSAKLRIAERL
ncbi:16S rRNA (cytosine(1402)-N(4))-methyltransferase RsmH [Thermophagus xiamenensis]|uniref:Ribosomal RNA small subunit methyltransferase H n=1 Tax=Thermophagus xiamenensis TaxID=385682 RepID=A0A1I1YL56_9BACT|nr:16S rRNA (cytosine(1402)-N(4))-methyltransferase RsmH [Thermophagus xiamenensis]SFE20276.1 16S rRNA (cytosine1402-N4)-methyltransferase [Thermophagus xiamenensis]